VKKSPRALVKSMSTEPVIIDATELILGRVASTVAKRLLQGETIVIVNAEKAAISGRRLSVVEEKKALLEVGHPGKGPLHPRRPDQIVRRTVRGMLPWKNPKGKEAYKRLRAYIGVPDEFRGKETQTIPEANAQRLKCPYIRVEELAKRIGWTPVGE